MIVSWTVTPEHEFSAYQIVETWKVTDNKLASELDCSP